MKTALSTLVIGVVAIASAASAAQAADAHPAYTPQDIKWGPAPPVLPAGAQAAVLYGDPSKEGLFALRLKMPQGYYIPPHTHPGIEAVTVISGNIKLGWGQTADKGKAQVFPVGSFWAMPPGAAHFAYADEETVLQITTNGPWGLTYLNPADDPRQKSQ